MLFHRLLVANRGEIAIRIFRAATELEIRTLGVYSFEDRFALHRYKADEAYRIGEVGDPLGAYLNWQRIIDLAKRLRVDAIHPGYGFLSENADFAQACWDAGICFVGPSADILRQFGDKILAKRVAHQAGVPTIPGPLDPLASVDQALSVAQSIGYPVTLKALSGGGGKGIRQVNSAAEMREAFERSMSEAKTSFGRADVYLEKTILRPKHIEVQVLGDQHGNLVHLFERDCSIQRRHQKVVEIAPAFGLPESVRGEIHSAAIKIAKSVQYAGVGTVEFLVDETNKFYFLEVNPRIQVEHTVTELTTGIDLVQASIVTAAGRPLSHPAIGIDSQASIAQRGVAIQCRITTEDPQNQFAPDTGRIMAYRPAQGFGVRLDEGHGTSGGQVTPHYDSLLVKLSTFGLDLYGAARKMDRGLREFRIRGVKHNVPLLINIVSHDDFVSGNFRTDFLTAHPELFQFPVQRDRATKVLRFIANCVVNNPHALPSRQQTVDAEPEAPRPDPRFPSSPTENAKSVFDRGGAEALTQWVRSRQELLLTDTTMRDAQQSLFATRMRTRDMLSAAPFYAAHCGSFFSLEVWGGATFDTALRFLREDPWDRLARMREAVPNTLLQMLLRGDNAVGYTNYPEWVIRHFIRLTKQTGLDVFRIFDCLNNPQQMAIAIDEVKNCGGIVEACICYTGNVQSPKETKYTLKYYVELAKQLKAMGTDILCIKDMAGLLRPFSANLLISALKNEVDLPIHLHTHSTSGNGVALLIEAAKAGCDIVDGAVSSMAGLTSQPSLNAVVAAFEDQDLCPQIDRHALEQLSVYWESVRQMYSMYDPGVVATSTRVYDHEIPGGQYSNLYDQARAVGLSPRDFMRLTERYQEVNSLLGNIVKVTPSSKVVGDLALLLEKQGLTCAQLMEQRPRLDYPDSVVSFMKGHMGVPYGGFPQEFRKMVLGENCPPPEKAPVPVGDSFESVRADLVNRVPEFTIHDTDVLSYRLYPKVYLEFLEHRRKYGRVSTLPTPIFFHGMKVNEEVEVDLEPGKTLYIQYRGVSEPDEKGQRTVFFELNGYGRQIKIADDSLAAKFKTRAKAGLSDSKAIGAPMPGKVLEVRCKVGDPVEIGQVLLVTESMKMEYTVTAKAAGVIKGLHVKALELVEEGDLLIELQ